MHADLDLRSSDDDEPRGRRHSPQQRKKWALDCLWQRPFSCWRRDRKRPQRRATRRCLAELCRLAPALDLDRPESPGKSCARGELLLGRIREARPVGDGHHFQPPPTRRARVAATLTQRADSAGERFFEPRDVQFRAEALRDFAGLLRAQHGDGWYEAWLRIGAAIFGAWKGTGESGEGSAIPWSHPELAALVAGRKDLSDKMIEWVRRSRHYFDTRRSDRAFARFIAQICRDQGPFGQRLAWRFGKLLTAPHEQDPDEAWGSWMYTDLTRRKARLDRMLAPRPALRAQLEDWVAHARAPHAAPRREPALVSGVTGAVLWRARGLRGP